jgi:PAS domain S-box-containing protein
MLPDSGYRRLVQGMRGCAIFSLDADGRISTWNVGGETLHGIAADDILGREFGSLFTDADSRVGTPDRILGAARGHGSAEEECWLVRGDGSRIWVDLMVTVLRDGDAIAGYGVVVRDESRRQALLDEARESNVRLGQASHLKSDFLAKMSHELRTPLTAMLGFSDVLLRGLDGELTELQYEDVARIRRSGLAILELVNDILDLSKIESGKMNLKLETLDCAELSNTVISSLGKLAEDKKLYLVTDFPETTLEVFADPLRVGQVLTNLVGNAIKFTERGGVTVRGSMGPTEVRIEVRDTGVGVAPEAVGMIWDEFRQGEAGARSHTGTGLGLAISRRLVNMQGGSIGMESTPDGGSCFWFTLPRPPGAPPVERRQGRAGHIPRGTVQASAETRELILVVEDDDATRRLISRRLKAAGFRTVEASGGAQAISAARELLPAVITLDMVMPSVDGWTVLAALRDDPRTRDIPVVVASVIDDREMAINLGAAEYVPKPFPVDDLLGVVERVLPDGNARVLVVDDDLQTLELVRRGLGDAGIQVEVAAGGKEALRIALDHEHDLVITDLLMPEMSGFELIVRLRAEERTRAVPIVVFTGKELDAADRATLNGQVLHLLEKTDIAPADLVSTVRESLRARRG